MARWRIYVLDWAGTIEKALMLVLGVEEGPEVGLIVVLPNVEVGREVPGWARPPHRVGLLFPGDVSS